MVPRCLALQDAPGSSSLFPAPSLRSAISPGSLSSFFWRMDIRNKDLASRCTYCYWSVVPSRSFQLTEQGKAGALPILFDVDLVVRASAERISGAWGWNMTTGFSQSEPILKQALGYLLTQDAGLRGEEVWFPQERLRC